MRNTQKSLSKLANLAAIVILAFNGVACASPSANGAPTESVTQAPANTAGAGPTQPPAPTAPQAPEEIQEENAVVTFGVSRWEKSRYEPLVEQFNQENPGITVQLVDTDQLWQGMEDSTMNYQRVLASAADVIPMYIAYEDDTSAYFRDLQPLIDSDASFDVDDFWPGLFYTCQDAEGRTLGIPLNASITGVYFDKAAFDQAGLPYPKPGWTYDDFQRAVRALAHKDGDEIRYGYADRNYLQGSVLAPLIDARLIDLNGELDAEALLESIQWYIDLAKAEAIYPLHEVGEDEWEDDWQKWEAMFKSDNRPVMWTGSLAEPVPGAQWTWDENDPFAGMAISTEGFAPYPVSPDTQNTSPIWAQCVGISAGSTHPRAAWAWINFLSRQWPADQSQTGWELSQVPARQSVTAASGYWDRLPESARPVVEYALDHAWPPSVYYQESEAVRQALTKALAGAAEFAAALSDAKATLVTTPQPTPNTTPIVVATPKPTADVATDATVLKFFTSINSPEEEKTIGGIIETFNQEHPDLQVKLSTDWDISPGNIEDWHAYLAENFDCFSWYSPYWAQQKPDSFLGLNALLQAEGESFIQDFYPDQLESYRYEGELYGLPAVSQPQIIAYNADLLAKRGLKPPAEDWTIDDFAALAVAAASTSEADRSYGLMYGEWEDLFFTERGVEWADLKANPPVPKFDEPEVLETLKWLVEINQAGAILIQTNDNWEEVDRAMREGQIAFWTAQAGQPAGWYFYDEEPSFKVGVAPYPLPVGDGDLSTWSSERGFFISRQTENAQACWMWIKYLSEQPNLYQGVPARRSVAESPEWETLVGKDKAEIYRLAVTRVNRAPDWDEYSPIGWPLHQWRSNAVRTALEGKDPVEALAKAQETSEAYLACMVGVDTEKLTDKEINEKVNECAKQVDPEGQWGGGGGGG